MPAGGTMNHETYDRNETLQGPSDRYFGIVFSVAFIMIAFFPLLTGGKARWWALVPGGAFLLASFLRPSMLSGMNIVWTKVGLLLHRVVSPVVLAIFFFVALSPFAVVTRLFRKNALHLSRDPGANSYWIARKARNRAKRNMSQQF